MTIAPPEFGAAAANMLWWVRGRAAARRLTAALRSPRAAQWQWLEEHLHQHRTCEHGRRFDFASIQSARAYAKRVPLVTYEDLVPDITRTMMGVASPLCATPVTHLAPTSGTTGAHKLIPFSRELQRGFSEAVDAWWADLVRQRPALLAGPSYWSISPLEVQGASYAQSSVRVGYSDDADYLGGTGAWLVRRAGAVPSVVRHVNDMAAFWGLTLIALLRRRGLRMLSVWHPSFVELLAENAERLWDPILAAIAEGGAGEWHGALPEPAAALWRAAPNPARAAELRHIGPERLAAWWPALAVISAWGDQAAASGLAHLRAAAPNALVQAKGLLATEGVVTFPFAGQYPVAIRSHFFEFIDRAGEVRQVHELERGGVYEVVLTNGGGLWRYRLGDVVECTGHLAATPTLRFLGRAGRGSDLRGEKLSDPFVAEVLRGLWKDREAPFAVLRAYEDGPRAGYELWVADAELVAEPGLVMRAEQALGANPHYALARRLGQLEPLRVVQVSGDVATRALGAHRGRLGDAKPQVLLPASEVSQP